METPEHIITSPLKVSNIPNCDLWTFFEDSFISKKNSIALIDPLKSISLTYGKLHSNVECIASNLLELGYNRDHPMVIYMNNSVEFIMAMLAVWRLGGSVAVINHLLTVDDIKQCLQLLDAEFMLCDQVTASNSIKARLGSTIKKLICTSHQQGCLLFSQLCVKIGKDENFSYSINPKDTALMAFSSGTTGKPKCVELSHQALAESICGLVETTGMKTCPNGGIIYSPLSHAAGYVFLLCHFRCGQKVVVMPQFHLERFLEYIQTYKVERLILVPSIAVMMCKTPLLQKYDLSSLKIVVCGAAPLGKDSEEELKRVLNYRTKVMQGYGMTETCSAGCYVPYYDSSAPSGSVGLVSPNSKAKVVDIDTGKTLGPNMSGELCFKGNYLMNGYLKNPKATSDMIRNRWIHTGDIGYYDKNGYFFVVDRLKELIKYNAYQVAPSELESVLLTHPGIEEVGVTSVPDKRAGELPQAWVVLKAGVSLSEDDIQAFVSDKVAPFKRLRGGVKFVEAIPKSPSGKIMRRLMKQQTVVSKL